MQKCWRSNTMNTLYTPFRFNNCFICDFAIFGVVFSCSYFAIVCVYIFFLNHLKVSCKHHGTLPQNTLVWSSSK